MKKYLVIWLMPPLVLHAQYFGERVTEKSFEESSFGIGVMPTPNFNINLFVNPQFDHPLRITQWWLSFRTNF